ncbi:MAG: FFLEELY motif protein [Omnitrophica WOR_2 bacterium]
MPIKPFSFVHDLENLRHQQIEAGSLDPKEALLRSWQSNRLARTYADLLQQPRYRPACLFFLNEVYAARDFAQRDHDIEQMYAFMRRFLPDSLLRPLMLTVEVNSLTLKLDRQLIEVMVNQLGVTDTITEELYAEGYRLCDNYDARRHQINLVNEIGSQLDRVVHLPFAGTALNIAKSPAKRAGWSELTDFLETGYRAFKRLRGADSFLNTIRSRELKILDRIHEGASNPFGFAEK